MPHRTRLASSLLLAAASSAFTLNASAQAALPTLTGTVRDPLGAVVPNATVEALTNTSARTLLASTTSSADGSYSLTLPAASQVVVRATAPSFRASLTPPLYLNAPRELDLTLDTPTRQDQVTVVASGTPSPIAQSGAPITVLLPQDYLHAAEVQEPLRLVPGVQMTQNGQTGGASSLFIRGGESNYNKVLLDGVPVNDLGGAVNFANLAATGIERIEILRQPSSVLYGSDVLSGVVNLTTARGTTPLPLLTYAIDGGSFGLFHQLSTLSGAHRQFDHYTAFSRLQTDNQTPADQFHNVTFAGNYGYAPDAATDLRLTFRHLATNAASPNAYDLYLVPDRANLKEQDTYLSATAQRQTTARWHNLIRYGHQALATRSTQWSPSGTLYTPPGSTFANGYLGRPVTITGANGYTVSGQAILDYTGTYPSTFLAGAHRDLVYAQTDYRLTDHLSALGAFKYEAERGDSFYFSSSNVDRRNQSYTLQLAGDARARLFYTLGSGIEHNQVYGNALTPRAALAFYAVRPTTARFFSGTKLHASFGKGVKESSVAQQNSSLYALLGSLPTGPALIARYGIAPLGAEYSRTYDAGIEQQFGDGRARVNLSWFHNQFTNGIQYVGTSALISQLGIPAAAANAAGYGSYVNSQAYRAEGIELESEFRLATHVFARAGYTWLDARVQRSFSSDALFPTFNFAGNFSTTPIGAYAPLVGARPFRRAPHSGYFAIAYTRDRLATNLTGTLVGHRDDSTFLSDQNFDSTLLLPNRNLDGAYQRLALSADYRLSSHLATYANLENLLNQRYYEAFGYPSLPFTIRGGMRFSFGGETFHLR